MSFGKIFECTFTGSMVGSGPTVFALWSYVIASTKPPGLVEINPVLVAAILGAPLQDVEAALDILQSPDARSRSKDADGRRLVKVSEFLYEVPTWRHYRESRNDEERKAYMREYMRDYRKKPDVKPDVNFCKPRLANAEAEAEAEALTKVKKEAKPILPSKARGTEAELQDYAKEIGLPASDGKFMFDHWEGNGWRNGQNLCRDWKAGIRKWKQGGWLPSQKMQGQRQQPENRANATKKPQTLEEMRARDEKLLKTLNLQ